MSTKVTLPMLWEKKRQGQRISMLTCYDYSFAKLLEASELDSILVGDSLGMVFQGQENTLPVTLDEMIYHTRAVRRGAKRPFLVTDMPFMSYQSSLDLAVENAGELVKLSGAEAVKIEGGTELIPLVERLIAIGIPVVGHIGLKPQSVHLMGGYKIQGKESQAASKILAEAEALSEAGLSLLVLEGIPKKLATKITTSIKTPTIGIGSGNGCDGQVLVLNDLLGLNPDFKPKFVREYAKIHQTVTEALSKFVSDISSQNFPGDAESF